MLKSYGVGWWGLVWVALVSAQVLLDFGTLDFGLWLDNSFLSGTWCVLPYEAGWAILSRQADRICDKI